MAVSISTFCKKWHKSQRGNYDGIPQSDFKVENLRADQYGKLDGKKEHESGRIGTTIELAARYYLTNCLAFSKAKVGAEIADEVGIYQFALEKLKGEGLSPNGTLSDEAWYYLDRMAEFENEAEAGRKLTSNLKREGPTQTNINHLNIMLRRCAHFFEKYGKPTEASFAVESRTKSVAGNGDFLSPNYLLDFKTLQESSGSPVKWQNRLQVTLYYLLGKEAKEGYFYYYQEFNSISKIIIYNPRTDVAYVADTASVTDDMYNNLWGMLDGY